MNVTVGEMRRIATTALARAGLSRSRAEKTAEILVQAEAWGLGSHGLLRLPIYLDRIAAGGHPLESELETVEDTGPLLTLSGHGGLGHWQLSEATSAAIERAGQYGIAGVAVADSGHCGALGVYAAQIARAGLAGLVFSCGPAVLPPWGGSSKLLSTSPIAAGFPLSEGQAVIDLALSTVARGKIAAYARSGEELPDGWALDAAGQPTNDPAEALTGMLAPLGGAKGFALAFMVEALTAGLVGPLLSADVPDFFDAASYQRPQRIAHLVLALDPRRTGGSGEMADAYERLDNLAERTCGAGGRVPGARRLQLDEIDQESELAIEDDLWHDLVSRSGKDQK